MPGCKPSDSLEFLGMYFVTSCFMFATALLSIHQGAGMAGRSRDRVGI